jgi:hypothetical protein
MPADVPACGVVPEAPPVVPVPAIGGGVITPVPATGGGVITPVPAAGGGVTAQLPAAEVEVPPEPAFCTGETYVTAGFAQPTQVDRATLPITINALVIVMVYEMLTF